MAWRMSAGLFAPSSAPPTGGSEWQKMQMDLYNVSPLAAFCAKAAGAESVPIASRYAAYRLMTLYSIVRL